MRLAQPEISDEDPAAVVANVKAQSAGVGELRPIASDDELPFLLGAHIPPTGVLHAVQTNLFFAAAGLHPSSSRNTFVLVRRRGANSEDEFTIREVSHVLLLGQQQPVSQPQGAHVVPKPNSREFKDLLDRRVEVHVQRELFPRIKRLPSSLPGPAKMQYQEHPEGHGMMRSMRLQDVMGSWPEWMLTRVRDHLQEVATYNKLNEGNHLAKSWTPQPDKRKEESKLLRAPRPQLARRA